MSQPLFESRKRKNVSNLSLIHIFLWKDLFVGRTAFQWVYLLLLSSVPFFLEWTNHTGQHDWLGLFASWTGIVCVILVAEGRASNYLFGAVNSAIYLVLALNKNFYGEVLTTLYFFIMQPIGLYVWLSNRTVSYTHLDVYKRQLLWGQDPVLIRP